MKFAICNSMDGLGGYYAKWNKSDGERQILLWYHLYVESKKYKQLVNKTKKKQTHRYRKQTSGSQWREARGRGNIEVGREKGLLWDYMKSCVWDFWKLQSIIEFKESFIQFKKIKKIF